MIPRPSGSEEIPCLSPNSRRRARHCSYSVRGCLVVALLVGHNPDGVERCDHCPYQDMNFRLKGAEGWKEEFGGQNASLSRRETPGYLCPTVLPSPLRPLEPNFLVNSF